MPERDLVYADRVRMPFIIALVSTLFLFSQDLPQGNRELTPLWEVRPMNTLNIVLAPLRLTVDSECSGSDFYKIGPTR